ncbi:hypothetical protein TrRE_jg447, partial [Triparma retinervis]
RPSGDSKGEHASWSKKLLYG